MTPDSPFDDPGAPQLDVLGTALLEETAPLAEEDRDEMDFELVEDAGASASWRFGRVDQHVLVPRGPLGLGHRRPDVGHIDNQRPPAPLAVGLMAGEDEDRHAVGVVAAPAVRTRRSVGL